MARFKFQFWLDADKDDELLLMEEIDELKSKRSFTKTIRDGIRLICDLRKGQVDVLFELFPWVKAEFVAGIQTQETPGEKRLRQQLERIEKQLLEQGNRPEPMNTGLKSVSGGLKPLTSGPKPLGAPSISAPDFDDDDEDLLEVKKDTSTQAGLNFLRSAWALQQ